MELLIVFEISISISEELFYISRRYPLDFTSPQLLRVMTFLELSVL